MNKDPDNYQFSAKKTQIEVNGIIVLDKPAGITSAKAISKIKHALNAKKIGHAGTLDPDATGILVCLLGSATKLADKFQGGTKIYQGTIQLGIKTKTDDLDGEILEQNTVPDFNDADLKTLAEQFTGIIWQTPPQISAIKIGGKRAFEIVRDQGQEAKLKPRQVTVYECEFTKIDSSHLSFTIKCGSGTYIRSIARDLGEKLTCGAAIATLRRTYSDPFSIEQAVKLEDINMSSILNINNFKENTICHHS